MVAFSRASLLLLASVSFASQPRNDPRNPAPQQFDLTRQEPAGFLHQQHHQAPQMQQLQQPTVQRGQMPVGQRQVQNRFVPTQQMQQPNRQGAPNFQGYPQQVPHQHPQFAGHQPYMGAPQYHQQHQMSVVPQHRQQPPVQHIAHPPSRLQTRSASQPAVQQAAPSPRPLQMPPPPQSQQKGPSPQPQVQRKQQPQPQRQTQQYQQQPAPSPQPPRQNQHTIPSPQPQRQPAPSPQPRPQPQQQLQRPQMAEHTVQSQWTAKAEQMNSIMELKLPNQYIIASLKEEEVRRLKYEEIARQEAILLSKFKAESAARQIAAIETQTVLQQAAPIEMQIEPQPAAEDIAIEVIQAINQNLAEEVDEPMVAVQLIETEDEQPVFVAAQIPSSPLNSSFDESAFQDADVFQAEVVVGTRSGAPRVKSVRKPAADNKKTKENRPKRNRTKEYSDDDDADFEAQPKKKAKTVQSKPAPARSTTRSTRSSGKAL